MNERGEWPAGAPLSTQIQGSEKKSLIGDWVAVLMPLIFFGFFFAMSPMRLFMRPGIPNPIAIVVGLVVVLMLVRAVWETIRLKRFGDPLLDLTQVPVPVGGTVEGRIALGPGLTSAPAFSVKLQCIRRVLKQGSKSSYFAETVLWTAEKTASLLPGGIVPVSIAVPSDQPESNTNDPFDSILWRLTVSAPFRGPSFVEKYQIPVQGRTTAAQKSAEEKPAVSDPPPVSGRGIFFRTLPALIFGLPIVAGGLYLLWFGVADVAKARASAAWPTAPGRIEYSHLPRSYSILVKRDDSEFAYTFDVNGASYTGHTIYPHILWRWKGLLETTRTYPACSAVTVSYSPSDPGNSCLDPGLRAGAFQRLFMALVVLTFGLILVGPAIFAPRDAIVTANSFTYRKGSTGSRVLGYAFWALVVWVGLLWWVT